MADPAPAAMPKNAVVILLDSLNRHMLGAYGGRAEIMVGEAWEEWIHQLTAILDESGLPTAARKDSDKQKGSTPSSFVAFVRELQECVPTACWRRRSDSALATAIGSAR